ncbi:MAG TPA: DNRLRE domain-containing protein, partial [bacterium]
VTPAISGNGVYSFAIANQHNDLASYSSKEGSQPPELVITTAGGAPATPVISAFTPTSGPEGTSVTVAGNNFVNVTQVTFGGTTAEFSVDSATQIRTRVPTGATPGPITVSTAAGSAVSPASFSITQEPEAGSSVSFAPTDDSFVRSNSPTNNYGSTFELRVRKSSSANFITYLKFNVTGLTATVQQARLRLRVIESSVDGGSIFAVSNNFLGTNTPWHEDGLNFGNAPALNATPLSSQGLVNLDEVVEFDVTPAITGNGAFSFAIRNTTNDLANYSSKEGVQAPELLILTAGDSEPPPPSPSPAPAITSFSPGSGEAGSQVTITGSGFTGATSVTFNGVVASNFATDSDTRLRATVPPGATTGPIRVSSNNGTGTSAQNFLVTEPEPDPDPDPDPDPSGTFTFAPVEDSFIRTNYPTNNYGGADELRVRKSSSADFISFLKFNVTGLTNTVRRATLMLRVIDAGVDGGAVYSVSNSFSSTGSPWNEETLNATNAPVLSGSPLSSRGAVALNEVVEFDVSAAIGGDGVYSFALRNSNSDLANYSSKEGVQAPELVIETGDGDSPLPTIASFTPSSGGVGTEVTIIGSNLSGSNSGAPGGTLRIMPLGDSITQGVHGSTDNAGYRNDLAGLLEGAGIAYNFVGTRDHGTGFDADHEGHSGYRADEILAELNSYLNSNPPDVILLHIGTNDISELQTPATTIGEVSNILDGIKNFDADIVTILSSVIPRSDSKNGATNTLNNYIRDVIPVKQNSGHQVFYAGNNEAFVANSNWPTQYLADSVHPNDTGYGVMAGVWLNAILNSLGVTPGLTVAFDGVSASSVHIDSETQVRATVPSGAATGKISVTNGFGTGFSISDFVVTGPLVTSKSSAPTTTSLMEIEQMILGRLPVEPRGDVDADGEVDLVDVLHLIDGGSDTKPAAQFSKRVLSGREASAALRIEPIAVSAVSAALAIVPQHAIAVRGFFIALDFDPAAVGFATPLAIENDHNFLIRSHLSGSTLVLLGYLKKSGESVSLENAFVNLPLQLLKDGLSREDLIISRAVFVAPDGTGGSNDGETIAAEPLPTEFALFQNYPNPFNAGTEIQFDLPQLTRLSLKIFNVKGELVRTLVNDLRGPGQYRIHWDAKNEHGGVVASGIYVYRLQTPNWESSKKLTLVK